MLYEETEGDNVANGVIVFSKLEETDMVICAVSVTFDEDDTEFVAVDELKKDKVPAGMEGDPETEFDNKGVCEIGGDIVKDKIDETEGLEEGLPSTDAEVDSKLDGVAEVVDSNEFDAIEADCEGDEEVDKVAEEENVFVTLGFTEFLGDEEGPTVEVMLTIEMSVTDGEGEREASTLILGDDDDEL